MVFLVFFFFKTLLLLWKSHFEWRMHICKAVQGVILACDSHRFVIFEREVTDERSEWRSTCLSAHWCNDSSTFSALQGCSLKFQSVYAWSWSRLMREQARRARLFFLLQHRAGIYPQTDVRSLCRGFGTEPNSTYLHSYLHGNPAAQPFYSSLHPSLLALPVPLTPPLPTLAPNLAFWNQIPALI